VSYFSIFFFFQAEDGIRDYKVTGVQTCALPISRYLYPGADDNAQVDHIAQCDVLVSVAVRGHFLQRRKAVLEGVSQSLGGDEQEIGERRVGKECRSRWWVEQ